MLYGVPRAIMQVTPHFCKCYIQIDALNVFRIYSFISCCLFPWINVAFFISWWRVDVVYSVIFRVVTGPHVESLEIWSRAWLLLSLSQPPKKKIKPPPPPKQVECHARQRRRKLALYFPLHLHVAVVDVARHKWTLTSLLSPLAYIQLWCLLLASKWPVPVVCECFVIFGDLYMELTNLSPSSEMCERYLHSWTFVTPAGRCDQPMLAYTRVPADRALLPSYTSLQYMKKNVHTVFL